MKAVFFSLISTLTLLAAPAQAAEPIWDGNKVVMTAEKLTPNNFAFYASDARELNEKGGAAATSSGIIVGDNGVMVIDSMLNKRLADQILALTKAVTNKPILYVVNTSSHGDHSFGNMYMPATAKIVQHKVTRENIAGHLAADKEFMIKYFGAGRGIEEIVARPADIVIEANQRLALDLGNRKVEIIDFGFAQTGGDLFVWDPQSKILWGGNAIIASKPTLPWLLDGHLIETLTTLQKVYDFLPMDARIVPGHGVPIGREALKWHIGYLTAIRDQVKEAVAAGLTLEQTVAKVKLPDYRGYMLFDWVHPALNVPAAYKDLSRK